MKHEAKSETMKFPTFPNGIPIFDSLSNMGLAPIRSKSLDVPRFLKRIKGHLKQGGRIAWAETEGEIPVKK